MAINYAAFDLKAIKLVSNTHANDVTVPNMAKAVKKEKLITEYFKHHF